VAVSESHPEESPDETRAEPKMGLFSGYELWRKTMLAGAVILLASSLARSFLGDGYPVWAEVAATAIGYLFLVYGFVLAMRIRWSNSRARKAKKQEPG
jgi:O-antigen/teichoic acid export membrane protein